MFLFQNLSSILEALHDLGRSDMIRPHVYSSPALATPASSLFLEHTGRLLPSAFALVAFLVWKELPPDILLDDSQVLQIFSQRSPSQGGPH